MRYNDQATILSITQIVDDMGGLTESYEPVKTVKCKVLPYTVQTTTDAGIPAIYSLNKLITKEKIDSELLLKDILIEHNGITYKKLSYTDYTKCIIIEMETK